MINFTFKQDLIRLLLNQSEHLFLNVKEIYALYFDAQINKTLAISKINGTEKSLSRIEEHAPLLNKLQQENFIYKWIDPKEITFKKSSKPATLFEVESNKTIKKKKDSKEKVDQSVLLIKLNRKNSIHKDLLFLCFEPHLKSFGLNISSHSSNHKLLEEQKRIIASIMYQNLLSIQKIEEANAMVYERILGGLKNIENEHIYLQKEYQQMEHNHNEHIRLMCEQIIERIYNDQQLKVQLSKNAFDKICSDYKGQFSHLEHILIQATELANMLGSISYEEIIIESHHLDFSNYSFVSEEKTIDVKGENEDVFKASALLDKLEYAIQIAKSSGITNYCNADKIGKHMAQGKLTGARISQLISTNQDPIVEVLLQYPEKWELLRKEYRKLRIIEEEFVLPKRRIVQTG